MKLPEFMRIKDDDTEQEKKKKKLLFILFLIFCFLIIAGIALALVFGVKRCSTAHTHSPAEAVHENEIAATCEIAGSYDEVVYCSSCNEEISRDHKTIDALGHEYIHHDAKSATETENGNIEYYSCGRCTKVFSADENKTEITNPEETVIPALGHNYEFDSFIWNDSEMTAKAHYVCSYDSSHTIDYDADMSHVTKDAETCLDNRVDTYTASYEGNQDSKEYEIAGTALGHNLVHHAAHEATCTEPAWDAYDTCSRCDFSTYSETAPALGHDFDDTISANVSYAWADLSTGSVNKIVECSRGDGQKETTPVTSKLSVIGDSSQGAVAVTEGFGLNIGDSVTVKATPNSDHKFAGWYSDSGFTSLISTNNPYTFSITSVTTLYAKYDVKIPGELPELVSGKIKYGLYPQTQVNSTLESELDTIKSSLTPDSNGYYSYKGNYYAESKYRSTSNYYWYKCEVITWRILKQTGNTYYAMSEIILDNLGIYHASSNNYAGSLLHTNLNNDFFNRMFALADQTAIQTMTVDNSAESTGYPSNPYAPTDHSQDTNDKVTVISYKEWSEYYSDKSNWKAKFSNYADARCVTKDGDYAYYWTRSPSPGAANKACYISVAGSAMIDSSMAMEVNLNGYAFGPGVRPCMTFVIS